MSRGECEKASISFVLQYHLKPVYIHSPVGVVFLGDVIIHFSGCLSKQTCMCTVMLENMFLSFKSSTFTQVLGGS